MAEYRPISDVTADVYESYLETGYFRQGMCFYQPVCITCLECIAIRINVALCQPTKSQRRLWRSNSDLRVEVAKPTYSDEKFSLYQRYHAARWGWSTDEQERFMQHMLRDWGGAWEFSYWEGDRLLALGIVDETPAAANSRYFIYEVEGTRSRGLGIYSLMHELEWCRQRNKSHLYLGMYVARASSMDYKVSFRPFELRMREGVWRLYADKKEALADEKVRLMAYGSL